MINSLLFCLAFIFLCVGSVGSVLSSQSAADSANDGFFQSDPLHTLLSLVPATSRTFALPPGTEILTQGALQSGSLIASLPVIPSLEPTCPVTFSPPKKAAVSSYSMPSLWGMPFDGTGTPLLLFDTILEPVREESAGDTLQLFCPVMGGEERGSPKKSPRKRSKAMLLAQEPSEAPVLGVSVKKSSVSKTTLPEKTMLPEMVLMPPPERVTTAENGMQLLALLDRYRNSFYLRSSDTTLGPLEREQLVALSHGFSVLILDLILYGETKQRLEQPQDCQVLRLRIVHGDRLVSYGHEDFYALVSYLIRCREWGPEERLDALYAEAFEAASTPVYKKHVQCCQIMDQARLYSRQCKRNRDLLVDLLFQNREATTYADVKKESIDQLLGIDVMTYLFSAIKKTPSSAAEPGNPCPGRSDLIKVPPPKPQAREKGSGSLGGKGVARKEEAFAAVAEETSLDDWLTLLDKPLE